MEKLTEIKKNISKNKKILKEKYKVGVIGIFGSYNRDELDKKNDIDILVEFSQPIDIFEFMELEEFLENLLGIKVDLVSKKALKPLIKDDILKETIYV